MHDHAALFEAAQQGYIIPVFIWPSDQEFDYTDSIAAKWSLHQSLISLKQDLATKGIPLIIRNGNIQNELLQLIKETSADAVFYNRCYEPFMVQSLFEIEIQLSKSKIEVQSFPGNLLYQQCNILNKNHEPYKVFTSYWKRTMQEHVPTPYAIPKMTSTLDTLPKSLEIHELQLLSPNSLEPRLDLHWEMGEQAAISHWTEFLEYGLNKYERYKDLPSAQATSLLSPYLVWGNISVKSIWHSIQSHEIQGPSTETFLRQLVWRDFAYDQLIRFPSMPKKPLREAFNTFQWEGTSSDFNKWTLGQTGYPLVDAGMRELQATGYMHNRVRMVVASFLVKHLLVPWTEGSKWFAQKLIDFDVANNAMGWQWTTGCGIDSAPYFRIFNPVAQGKRFDPNGDYVRQWIPELKHLPKKFIHQPWEASEEILALAHIELGKDYPFPIVEHNFARKRALQAYNLIKKA
ncbi:cryptochrome/photolyase family protein [Viridibacillus sp. NPDC093762]|uniref:cryptochrome/photolyase family protein n=1 Tax=Viridibacillus sp. NPDC093762 TaxID=3390720 RepID=UPI003D03D1B8